MNERVLNKSFKKVYNKEQTKNNSHRRSIPPCNFGGVYISQAERNQFSAWISTDDGLQKFQSSFRKHS